MMAPKVCLGCFREWNEENPVCACCGWEPDKDYGELFEWAPGMVIEKRYLLGLPFCATEDAAVWRAYDNVLKTSCFVLQGTFDAIDFRHSFSEKTKEGRQIEIMAAKVLDGKAALLFSMRDPEANKDELEAALRRGSGCGEEPQEESPGMRAAQKREQVLPDGTVLGGRYRILDCIGIGGFGIIYLCEEIALRRLVAVKEYFPSEWVQREEQYVAVKKSRMVNAYRFGVQSFYKEAQIMAKFIHTPHIVTVYDIMEENDTVYLAMEYISGISIGREMRARNYQPYSAQETAEILLPVLGALRAMHTEGIVHSDISPGNIMRSSEGDIVLIDFGAAKYTLESQPVLSAAFLKPDYAAPEQYRTAKEGVPRDEGPWTDVYACGATIYYLLTGRKPPDVLGRLGEKSTKIALPAGCRLKCARRWTKVLNRAMEPEFRERIQSVDELEKTFFTVIKRKNKEEQND